MTDRKKRDMGEVPKKPKAPSVDKPPKSSSSYSQTMDKNYRLLDKSRVKDKARQKRLKKRDAAARRTDWPYGH